MSAAPQLLNFSGGEFTPGAGYFPNTSPAAGEVACSVYEADKSTARAAACAACQALSGEWAGYAADARSALPRRIADIGKPLQHRRFEFSNICINGV